MTESDIMVKRVIKVITIIIAVIVVIFGVFFLYANKMKTTENYMYSFAWHIFNETAYNWHHCADVENYTGSVIKLVDYDMLSDKYKRIVSKDEYTNAETDEQIYDIYKRIAAANTDQRSEVMQDHSVSTTQGLKMSEGTDGFIIDGKAYHITHHFDFKPRLFSDTPYISKWMIDIREVSIDENED
jgi:hypothetical protein